jgi:hypothetical protein
MSRKVATMTLALLFGVAAHAQTPAQITPEVHEDLWDLEMAEESAIAPGEVLYGIGPSSISRDSTDLYRIDNPSSSPSPFRVGPTGVNMLDLGIDPTTGRIYAIAPRGGLSTIERQSSFHHRRCRAGARRSQGGRRDEARRNVTLERPPSPATASRLGC